MPAIPVQRVDFRHGNAWGIKDGFSELDISMSRLRHAALTVGHRGWRGFSSGLSPADWQTEVNWRLSTFANAVHEETIPAKGHASGNCRLVPRASEKKRDGSEKNNLHRSLGMTVAAAWAAKVLKIPWLLHLDVYWAELGLPPPDRERPDLIGLSRACDSFIVVEAKGYGRKHDRAEQTKAKNQAKRIVNVGGTPPSLNLAMFTFFGPDKQATGRPKPKVVNLWAVDPPLEPKPDSDGDEPLPPIKLPELAPELFLKLYYRQWAFLFSEDLRWESRGLFRWITDSSVGVEIGILDELFQAVTHGAVSDIPKILDVTTGAVASYPGWIGDGILVADKSLSSGNQAGA